MAGFGQEQAYTARQVKGVIDSIGLRTSGEVESDYIVYCPFHNNSHTAAAEIDKRTGMLYCFGCKTTKPLVRVVMLQANIGYFEALRLIESQREETDIVAEINSALQKKPEFVEFDMELVRKLNENALMSERAKHYLLNRNIGLDSIKKYMLGYSTVADSITIPVHSAHGMVLGFISRSIEGKDFKNTPKLPKSKTLFNLWRNRLAKRVFVVESAFDAIRIEQHGYAACALMGSNLSKTQQDLLRRYFTDIIVVGDNDSAGRQLNEAVVQALTPHAFAATLAADKQDIGKLDEAELATFLDIFNNPLILLGDNNGI